MSAPVIFGRAMRPRKVPAFPHCFRLYNVEVRTRSPEGYYWEASFKGVLAIESTAQGAVDELLKKLSLTYYEIKKPFDGDP